jgi:Trp operon repressor
MKFFRFSLLKPDDDEENNDIKGWKSFLRSFGAFKTCLDNSSYNEIDDMILKNLLTSSQMDDIHKRQKIIQESCASLSDASEL